MNMMNNMSQNQNLMNMKNQLINIESIFNQILTQNQCEGLTQDSKDNLIKLSIQFINFGIQLLNLGIANNYNIYNMNTYLKPQLEKAIKDLENINQNYIPKFFYNVNFQISDGNSFLIVCEGKNTVDYLIKEFLKRIKRYDLFDMEEKEFYLDYNASKFNTHKNKSRILYDIFGYYPNLLIKGEIL